MGEERMNVIYGDENLKDIQEKHTTLELDTIQPPAAQLLGGAITVYAVVGPGDIPFENFVRLKQFIPVHEALMKNYKQQNLEFCKTAIEKLIGSIDPFMDTFYCIMLERIKQQQDNPVKNWSSVVKVS